MAKKHDKGKQTAIEQFFEAVKSDDTKAIEELLAQGVPVDCRDDVERTPLIRVAEAGNLEITKVLLDHGADVNAVDADGDTPLTASIYSGKLDIVQLLTSRGADVNVRNAQGQSALDIAQELKFKDIATHLASLSRSSAEPTEDKPEDDVSVEEEVIEAEEAEEISDTGNVDDGEIKASTTAASTAAAAQQATENLSEFFSMEETEKKLAEVSPKFFGKPSEIPICELAKLVNSTNRQSEAVQKKTGIVLVDQAEYKPDLLKKLAERGDVIPHRGTIKRWMDAGNAEKKLVSLGVDTTPLGTWQLQELSKAPDDEAMKTIAKEALSENLSVRDIRKRINPLIKRAKLEESGVLAEVGPECLKIIEGLDSPEILMGRPHVFTLFQDYKQLKSKFTVPELSRILEKANSIETKIEKQKRTFEEKGAAFVPVINFLQLVRKTIIAAFEGDNN